LLIGITASVTVSCDLIWLSQRSTASADQADAAASLDGPQINQPAPRFYLHDQYGKARSLPALQGRSILAFFCGCQRCHDAARRIAALQKYHKINTLTSVVALDAAGVHRFQKSTKLEGTLLADPTDIVAKKYASEFCPRIWVIDADGRIIYRSESGLAGLPLSKAIDKITAL